MKNKQKMKRSKKLLIIIIGIVLLIPLMIYGYALYQRTGPNGNFVQLNGINMYYEVKGQGEPLVVLHGDLSDTQVMGDVIDAFSKEYKVIAVDRRAHGRTTDVKDKPLMYADMADDVVALLDHLGIEKTNVFGWSGGGNTALGLAINHPNRIDKVALYGTTYNNEIEGPLADKLDPNSWQSLQMRILYMLVSKTPDYWETFVYKVADLWRNSNYTIEEIASIKAPVLSIVGEFDTMPHSYAHRMVDAMKDGKLVILDGKDHYVPVSNPELITPLILDFLKD